MGTDAPKPSPVFPGVSTQLMKPLPEFDGLELTNSMPYSGSNPSRIQDDAQSTFTFVPEAHPHAATSSSSSARMTNHRTKYAKVPLTFQSLGGAYGSSPEGLGLDALAAQAQLGSGTQ